MMNTSKENNKVNIGRSDIRIEDGKLTPEVLWAMGRIGGVAVSPDGSKVVYQVTYYSVDENKSHTVLYAMTDKGEKPSGILSPPLVTTTGKVTCLLSPPDSEPS